MADIVNLRQARKQKARAQKQEQAAENRARFGQTKAAREKAALVDAIEAKRHTLHKRDVKDE